MRLRVGVVNNLRAGRNRPRVHEILDLLGSCGGDVFHVETDSAAAVPEVMSEMAAQGVDLLVANGGDGTLHRILTEILYSGPFERVPMVAPLRGGRTNMTALDLGADRRPVRGLAKLLRDVRDGRLDHRRQSRPVLRIEPGPGLPAQYGMFFGSGVVVRAIERIHSVFPPGKARGVFGAGVYGGQLLLRAALDDTTGILTPDKMQIRLDGGGVDAGEFLVAMACTLDRLFLRLRPFWGAEAGSVRFTAIASSARGFRRALPSLLRGRHTHHATPERGYVSRNVHEAVVQLDSGFTLDGELFEALPGRTLRIEAVEGVRFLRA